MTGSNFLKKTTSRSTSKRAEQRAAEFHFPGHGRRTPLSGSNSGATHADCLNIPGLFIEAKLRASHSLWTLYNSTRKLARKESLVPVVTLFKKYENGFIDCVHSDFIDIYIERMVENRRLEVKQNKTAKFGETELALLYSGSPTEIELIISKLNTFSFNEHGHLKDDWFSTNGSKLELWVVAKTGFNRSLYGRFPHPFKAQVHLDPEKVRLGLRK